MSGAVDQLKRRITDTQHARSFEMLTTSVERATRLTGHLLAFSRQKTHLKETADLCRHLTSLEEVLRRSLRGDIEIRLLVDQSPCFVSVDISELELALLNVAVNARDAMPNGGTLSITVQKVSLRGDETPEGLKGGFVRIAVEDTGVGITADVIARVFEPFFTTKDIGKGTGLGLSQVYGFVHQSNGAITINSVPGKGTTVLMYLPTVSGPELSAPAPNPAYIKDAQLNKTVLVVEDNLEVSRVCRAYLEQLGYQVVEVSTANAALDLMASDAKIDIVVTDIVMPGGTNGVELARQLRSKHPRLPIVLTTGYTAQTALDTSEFPLLRKPYNLDELRKRLGEAVSHTA
jgi:two-component system NtrC family sensor kinase